VWGHCEGEDLQLQKITVKFLRSKYLIVLNLLLVYQYVLVSCVDDVNVISVLSKTIIVKKKYVNSDMEIYCYISKNFIIM